MSTSSDPGIADPRPVASCDGGHDASEELVELPADAVTQRLAAALEVALEIDSAAARATIEHFVRAEQSGKDCHGLIRVPYVAQSGKFGPYRYAARPELACTDLTRVHVDAAGHFGYPVMDALTRAGVRTALEHGHCLATGSGVYPSGCLGDWGRVAAREGVASLIMAGSPPRVAAPTGARPLVGTNPLCVSMPAMPLPFVCDASTSAITHGDLLLARDAGKSIEPGSAVDADGNSSVDPTAVDPTRGLGALLPVGGSHKTFAMAMAIELLTSLGGGIPGSEKLAEHGVFALFIGPDLLADTPDAVGRWLSSLEQSGVRIPGWDSGRQLYEQESRGTVRISAQTARLLEPMLEP